MNKNLLRHLSYQIYFALFVDISCTPSIDILFPLLFDDLNPRVQLRGQISNKAPLSQIRPTINEANTVLDKDKDILM